MNIFFYIKASSFEACPDPNGAYLICFITFPSKKKHPYPQVLLFEGFDLKYFGAISKPKVQGHKGRATLVNYIGMTRGRATPTGCNALTCCRVSVSFHLLP
jgi:hypothetical protein